MERRSGVETFGLPTIGVLVRNVGHPEECQSVVLESRALEGRQAANAGLCVVGLDEADPSVVSLNV
ncbi:hypothetical protein [Halomarina litorea]|uniref:hypothetical protein n=1 Tax=Halomarina litorea TaxID=2961595 RepID=UPI0020C5544D|nr:hypothetical protein [Halomarina sp. BCD28]